MFFFFFFCEESEFLNGTCTFFTTRIDCKWRKVMKIHRTFLKRFASLIPSFEKYERKGNVIDY